MAKIHKLTRGENTIYPATIPQAVVDPANNEKLPVTLAKKAEHGYESNPKSLKEVDDEKAEHGYAVEETPKTLKEVDTLATQNAEDISQLASQVIYDVTKNNPTAGLNNDGKFESLSTLLLDADLSTLIPSVVRCGGMSIRFVQSSDNKYVQYRLTSDTFNTTEANWQGDSRVFDGGRADSVYGGARNINCGNAQG